MEESHKEESEIYFSDDFSLDDDWSNEGSSQIESLPAVSNGSPMRAWNSDEVKMKLQAMTPQHFRNQSDMMVRKDS